jgi:hypothetical protein
MVHALELIHRLLKPDGQLIDIHPSTEAATLEVRVRDRHLPAGWLQEEDDYIEYELADAALDQVVETGLFALERSGEFRFIWHADTLDELRAYLAEEWQDAIVDDLTFMRAEELLATFERDKEVILHETIRIARFRKL